MSTRNTLIRSMHDLGLAAWFGGSLMGAIIPMPYFLNKFHAGEDGEKVSVIMSLYTV